MKKYILKVLFFSVAYMVFSALLDIIFHELKPMTDYLVQGVLFAILVVVLKYLDDKGWNSWERIGNLFKKQSK